jgi:hypothetical protein
MTSKMSRTTQTTRRASRTRTKRLEAEDNPKKALKLEDKLEEDQGYASVLPAARAKKQPQRPKDMLKGSSKDSLEKGKQAATRDVLEKHRTRENSLLEAAVYTYKKGSLRTGLWIRCLVNTKSLNQLHRYRASAKRLHSQGLNRLSTDIKPTGAEPRSYV